MSTIKLPDIPVKDFLDLFIDIFVVELLNVIIWFGFEILINALFRKAFIETFLGRSGGWMGVHVSGFIIILALFTWAFILVKRRFLD